MTSYLSLEHFGNEKQSHPEFEPCLSYPFLQPLCQPRFQSVCTCVYVRVCECVYVCVCVCKIKVTQNISLIILGWKNVVTKNVFFDKQHKYKNNVYFK